ncbi:metal-sulfur cluster assembly factor [Lactobacillus reuteri]|uniref:metal-sulfur cluster assembly factor n=1 Tax=Limosilactobacillus reuteri TaxID=1598 RepID=UPI00146A311E|nr:metal-sulfur cluster assembly factor [Limosilactobacillus reuteri]NMV54416.1 metal-sulfur cluster assembly factor [Limosilactobacillus reuteri]NMV58599.1 metal-sulfur cluster assembly factor [Limosilactobacillus reuteri]
MAADQNKGNPFSPLENKVMDALQSVIDPELGVDIVNLGLIYDVQVNSEQLCTITMTLTTMGCPISGFLNSQIIKHTLNVDGVKRCKLNLVWEPRWTPDMMTRYAKILLGIHN